MADEHMNDLEKAVEQNGNMLDGIINNGANEREIPGTFDDAEREALQQFEEMRAADARKTEELERAKSLINKYSQAEFGSPADFSDLASVGLAYTTLTFEDELRDAGVSDVFKEFEIQVDANLLTNEITTFIDGDELDSIKFDSLTEMNGFLENLDFDSLIYVEPENRQKIAERMLNEEAENALNEHEAEFGADGSRVFPHLNDEPRKLIYLYPMEVEIYKDMRDVLETGDFDIRITNDRTISVPESDTSVEEVLTSRGIRYALEDPAEVLAVQIDALNYDFDTYAYQDVLTGTREDAINDIYSDIRSGNVDHLKTFLNDVMESDDVHSGTIAYGLLGKLDEYIENELIEAIDDSDVSLEAGLMNVGDSFSLNEDSTLHLMGGDVVIPGGEELVITDIVLDSDGESEFKHFALQSVSNGEVYDLRDTDIDRIGYKLLNHYPNYDREYESGDKDMNFDEFKAYVQEHIKEFLPEQYENASVTINEVVKNNDSVLTGITIRNEDSNIAPNIYLENFFNQLQDGRDINDIMHNIAEIRVANEVEQGFDATNITDLDKVKDRIIPILVNAEMNENYLSNKPFTQVNDLAVIYKVDLGGNFDGHATVPITNSIMDGFGLSVEQLHDIAMTNLDAQEIYFKSMRDTMIEMRGGNIPEFMLPPEEEMPLMYVLTNSEKLNGATEILSEKVMDDISEKVGGNFFIIPSSVHEVLIIPITPEMDKVALEEMISTVNDSGEVLPEDKLSYNLYGYNSEEHKLVLAGDLPELSGEVTKEADVVQFPTGEVKVAEDEGIDLGEQLTEAIRENGLDRKALNESAMQTSEIINKAEEKMEKEQLTITVPGGLVKPPYDKNGVSYCRVMIPPADSSQKAWDSFVVRADQITQGENGSKTISIGAEASHTLYHPTVVGNDENGRPQYVNEKTKVPNTEIKAMLDERTSSVTHENDNKHENETFKVSANCVSASFTSAKDGKEMVAVKVPNEDPADKSPWATFIVPASNVSEKDDRGKREISIPSGTTVSLQKSVPIPGTEPRQYNREDAGKMTAQELKDRFSAKNIKAITSDKDKVKEANAQNKSAEKKRDANSLE